MFRYPAWVVATEAAHQLPKMSDLGQQEVVTDEMVHPVRLVSEGTFEYAYPVRSAVQIMNMLLS